MSDSAEVTFGEVELPVDEFCERLADLLTPTWGDSEQLSDALFNGLSVMREEVNNKVMAGLGWDSLFNGRAVVSTAKPFQTLDSDVTVSRRNHPSSAGDAGAVSDATQRAILNAVDKFKASTAELPSRKVGELQRAMSWVDQAETAAEFAGVSVGEALGEVVTAKLSQLVGRVDVHEANVERELDTILNELAEIRSLLAA